MENTRRIFLRSSLARLASASGGSFMQPDSPIRASDPAPKKHLTGDALQELVSKSKLRIAVAAPPDASAPQLSFYKQAGLAHVVLSPEEINVDTYADRKKYFSDAGLEVFGITNNALINDDKIVLNLPGRDESIEAYKQHLRALGKAGINYTTYAHSANGVWRSADGTARSGAVAESYDPAGEISGQWGKKKFHGPLSHGKAYTQKQIWDNFKYFIQAIAPVAREAKVKIGIVPDDPPVTILAGVPRIFSSFAGYRQALEMAKSNYVGACLDVGIWAKAGNGSGKDAHAMIDYFGKQKRLFKVILSNVNAGPAFTETFVDTGIVDIYRVMKSLRKIQFDGIITGDHIPQMVSANARTNAAYDPSLAWTIGYIKCLRDRVEEESVI